MCGIAGVVRSEQLERKDHAAGNRLPNLIRHRGPDSEGVYTGTSCILVQTRLALIGPADCPLPHRSTDGRYILVYNGEVYNFEEIRRQLDSQPSRHATDAEVVLAAWLRWGPDSLRRLNGMFAFFIWDTEQRRGVAATDPLGIKPLYYHAGDDRFAFASEAGVLVESGLAPFTPEPEAVAEALVAPYFSSAVELPFAGITRLPPGHWLEWTRDRVTVAPYFRFQRTAASIRDADAFVSDVSDAVEKAVVSSLHADSPIGVFLSGGVDSSLLAAIAQKHSPYPFPAWTIAYRGQETADYSSSLIVKSVDQPFAESVAVRHGLAHEVIQVDDELFETALTRTLRTNDLICAWEQEVSQQLLAAAASRLVKAVLVGDAADETHFGYSFLLNPQRVASPRRIVDYFGSVPLRDCFLDDAPGHFTRKYELFAEKHGHSWKTPGDQILAMSCLVYHLWLTRLLHNGDIHLMSYSLEGRVPFGDTRLLALAQSLPPALAMRNGIEKWHLRRAAERFLEPAVAWRPKSALTKNLHAHAIVHRRFAAAWRESGAFVEPYVDCDAVEGLASGGTPKTEVEVGLCFRLLAVMTWFARFSGACQ